VVEKHRFLLKDKPIQMTVLTDPTLMVSADRGLLFIIIANLVRNAFAYTEQGQIQIVQDHSSLSIIDSGCGMSPRQTESYLQNHFRAASPTKGWGIGLSLVKRICDQYGWTIKMTSQEGRGTTISIFFSV
ncbi:MAG TPA: HAMP domain-containing histidine kinase, partial [Magnetococcales bacterium]|nr:HAMP domain-containing histidine kinase [Magnetococcales bacterium]